MTNFIKWIEYLATEPNYCFETIEKGYFGTQYFTLIFRDKDYDKTSPYNNYFQTYINLTEYEPKKLLTWYNNQTQYALNNDYKNTYEPIFYTAQHFLKLIKELKANGIDFIKCSLGYIPQIKLTQTGISIQATKNQIQHNYFFEDKDFRDLNKSTKFQLLLNFLKEAQNE